MSGYKELADYGIHSIFELMKTAFDYRRNSNHQLATATSEHNIAVLYFLIYNNIDLAVEYTEKALEIRMNYYGNNHPSTISSRVNLGTFYLLKDDDINIEKGVEQYESLLQDINNMTEEQFTNVRQVLYIIKENTAFFEEKVKININSYRLADLNHQCAESRQIHETYGMYKCCSGRPNFIVNKEVSNITIVNK